MSRTAAFVLALAACAPASAADLFVDRINGSDANDGLSWATARAAVASAIATAAASPEPDVISVAAGRYVEQLVVPADTTLLGGFPSGGGGRDPAANQTLLDGGGTASSVVHFPPGSDRTVLDGFTVTGGRGSTGPDFVAYGGGIFAEDSAPLIRGNVIEDNEACHGGGVALIYSSSRAAARVEGNVIRRNGFPWPRPECARGRWATGAGVFVRAPPGVDLGVVLSGNRISQSLWGIGAVWFQAQGTMEHDVVEQNPSFGLALSGGPVRVFNEAVTGNQRAGVSLDCGGAYRLENVTIAFNAAGVAADGGGVATTLDIENSILWADSAEVTWMCAGSAPSVVSSLVQGGFAGGVNIIDADPLFMPGPFGSYYLSQVAAGQAATSPAVDAGSQPALTVGLDQRTTATDSAPDAGTVDLGFHPARVLTLTVLRGTVANSLAAHRTVSALPFTDDPGTLSDPALRLLFYEVAGADNNIAVEKDIANDAVRLTFR